MVRGPFREDILDEIVHLVVEALVLRESNSLLKTQNVSINGSDILVVHLATDWVADKAAS